MDDFGDFGDTAVVNAAANSAAPVGNGDLFGMDEPQDAPLQLGGGVIGGGDGTVSTADDFGGFGSEPQTEPDAGGATQTGDSFGDFGEATVSGDGDFGDGNFGDFGSADAGGE